MEATLRKLISDHYLDEFADQIVAAATPAIKLVKELDRGHITGQSQLGGVPDVPPDFAWPACNGNPLGFIAQINFTEIASADPAHVFPASGMLYFFCDIEEWPGGYDPKDAERFCVIHIPAPHSLSPAVPPANLVKAQTFPSVPLGFRQFLSIPDLESAAGEPSGIGGEWYDEYSNLQTATHGAESNGTGKHQLLGCAAAIQGDMQLHCQLASNGIDALKSDGKDPRAEALKPAAADWQLLAQLDTDDDLGIMWGDGGTLFFWIKEEDLRQHRFESAWACVQCF